MANTKKRFLSLLMAMVMILGLLPTSAFATQVTPEEAASRANQTGYKIELTVKAEGQPLANKTVTVETYNYNIIVHGYRKLQTYTCTPDAEGKVVLYTANEDEYNPNRAKVTYVLDGQSYTSDKEKLTWKGGNVDAYRATLDVGPIPPPKTEQDLLNSLADKRTSSFKVYRYYDNIVPEEIHKNFEAKDFGPKGDDSPYFTVTVDMAELLAIDGIDICWIGSTWYVSAQSCKDLIAGDKDTNADRLAPFWANVLTCMSEEDQAKFASFGIDEKEENAFLGYVLKPSSDIPHIDGIVNLPPPVYNTELYINRKIVASDSISEAGVKDPKGRPYSFVQEEYKAYLDTTYNKGVADSSKAEWKTTDGKVELLYTSADGNIYQLKQDTRESNAWPVKADGETIKYTALDKPKEINMARFFLTAPVKLTHAYTVEYVYNYSQNGGTPVVAGIEKIPTAPAATDPTAAVILLDAPATAPFNSNEKYDGVTIGQKTYNKTTTITSTGTLEGDNLKFIVDYALDETTPAYTINYEFYYQLDNDAEILAGTQMNAVTKHAATAPKDADVLAAAAASVDFTSKVTDVPAGAHPYATPTVTSITGDFQTGELVATVKYLFHQSRVPHTYTVNAVYKYKLDNGEYVEAAKQDNIATNSVTIPLSSAEILALPEVGASKEITSEVEYNGKAIGKKTYTATEANVTSSGEFAENKLVYTVTYTCDDVTPTYQYNVRYELHFIGDGEYPVTTVDATGTHSAAATPADETVWTAAVNGVTRLDGEVSHSYQKAAKFAGTEISSTGALAAGTLVYTVKYYYTEYKTGTLAIHKTFEGINEVPENLTFTITGPEGYKLEVPYGKFTLDGTENGTPAGIAGGTYTTENRDLVPGVYTVTETNAEVAGYQLTSETVYTVNVEAGLNPTSLEIHNAYTSKEYRIIFDAAAAAKAVNHDDAAVIGVRSYDWCVPEGSQETTPIWSGSLNENDKTVSKIVYTFNYADYLADNGISITAPAVTDMTPGYHLVGFKNGDTEYTSLADAVTEMNKMTPVGEEPLTLTYTAEYAPDTTTAYTVNYYYQNENGLYPTATSVSRTGTTGADAKLAEADKIVNPALGLANTTYVLDESKLSENDNKTIAGDGSTALNVYFKWQAGVTYVYAKAPDGVPAKAPALPIVEDKYSFGTVIQNTGAAAGTKIKDDNGTWTLSWDKNEARMDSHTGITFTGTWSFAAAGTATVTVRFVDEAGNKIAEPTSQTLAYGAQYNLDDAKTVVDLTDGGYTYRFLKDYTGEFKADQADVDVTAYAGAMPRGGVTIQRVYEKVTASVMVTKTYTGVTALPDSFNIEVMDGGVKIATLTKQMATATNGQLTWTVKLPIGRTYTFTEKGYAAGANYSTVLTAKRAIPAQEPLRVVNAAVQAPRYTLKDLTVSNFAFTDKFTAEDVLKETCLIFMNNAYTYTAPPVPTPDDDDDDDDDRGPVIIPDEPAPTTDLPETEVPTTDLPETEVPMAEAPATGDNLAMWILAAAVSGLGLVWLAFSGKKREDESAE